MQTILALIPIIITVLYLWLFKKNYGEMVFSISNTAEKWLNKDGEKHRLSEYFFILYIIAVSASTIALNQSVWYVTCAAGMIMYVGICSYYRNKVIATIHNFGSVIFILGGFIVHGFVLDTWIPLMLLASTSLGVIISKPKLKITYIELAAIAYFFGTFIYKDIF